MGTTTVMIPPIVITPYNLTLIPNTGYVTQEVLEILMFYSLSFVKGTNLQNNKAITFNNNHMISLTVLVNERSILLQTYLK